MKTTFCQNLRHKLLEIFHPRDFRKATPDTSCPLHNFCGDKGCTDNCNPVELENKPVDQSSSETQEFSGIESVSRLTKDEDYNAILSQRCAERSLMLRRILIKVIIICVLALFTLLLAPKSRANDRQSMVSLSAGVLYPNGVDITGQYERYTSHHSAWAVELNGYLRWRKCPDCNRVCVDSFWEYYHSYHIGMVYKPCVYRSRNQHGRLRLGASIGYDERKVIAGVLLGYEQTYCLHYGLELFWTAKADVQVLAKNWIRPGVSIGLRLPI